MFKAATLLSLIVVAVTAAITPELTGMSSVAKGSASIPASDASLPLCDDLPPISSTVEQRVCITQLDASSVAPSQNVTAIPADGLTCAQDIIAPTLGDAQTLCNVAVPAGQFTVPQGSASNVCTCVIFESGNAPSAWFKACNCDFCSAAVFENLQNDCLTIASSCVAHGVGGFGSHTAPNTMDVLFLANSDPAITVGTNC
ncbi:hypothetical protein C8Q80DRAFT_1214206 [Daedaleopsis nitida]|nr:hypothetical protein C8Q80DRAFT_1214206 [Daedaleopsis nitida]